MMASAPNPGQRRLLEATMPENLPDHVIAARARLATFINKLLLPLEARRVSGDEIGELRQEVREASRQAGFYAMTQPAEFGGEPADTLMLTALREQLAAANTPLADSVFGPGPGLLHAAEGELRTRYLEPVLLGEKRGAFGFTEPDNAPRPTWAVLDGNELIITGQKSYVTGGADCDFVAILVNVERTDGEKAGTAMVVVDKYTPGVRVERSFTSLEGGGHVSMVFEQVRVPVWQMIGRLGEGMPRALGTIGDVRLMVAARATGMCLWALDFVEAHLQAPHRSGSPLGDHEGVRLRYADMRIETYAARSVLYRAARCAASDANSVNEVITAKVMCTETAGRVIDMAVQLVGGQALVTGHPLEVLYRQVRSLRLVEGANDLLRLNLVKGRLVLHKGEV